MSYMEAPKKNDSWLVSHFSRGSHDKSNDSSIHYAQVPEERGRRVGQSGTEGGRRKGGPEADMAANHDPRPKSRRY